VNHEGFVLVLTKDVLDKFKTGIALTIQNPGLAAAGVNQQAERERKVDLLGELPDGLSAPVLLKCEIVLDQVVDNFALFVAYGCQDVDDVDTRGELGILPAEERQGSSQIEEVTPGQHQTSGRR
jgi:hypothetical protein